MKIQDLKPGMKVVNRYGVTLTVLEVIDGLMVRTFEDLLAMYHHTKLWHNGKRIEA